MIDKLITSTLNILKTNASMVLIFYASGFLSFIAYYRVLGIPYINGDLQTYAELAGRNIIIILQTFIFLVTKPNLSIISDLSWAGFWIYSWLILAFILITAIFIKQNHYDNKIQLPVIAFIVISTLHIETQPLYATNILQPSFIKFNEQKKNIINYEKLTNKIDYKKRVKIFKELNRIIDENNNYAFKSNNDADFLTNFFFSISESYDESGKETRRLNALMLIILIVSITAVILVIYRQHKPIRWLMFLFVFAQAILIPFNCGILGAKYQFPIISLDYSEKDKVSHKEGVFLLTKSQDNLVIYDRLNFFQISYIPQSSILNIEQFFTSSPFSNCSNGDFEPCEIYAIK